jgi:hypothetical protein
MVLCLPSIILHNLCSQFLLEMCTLKISSSLKDKRTSVSTPNKTLFQPRKNCREGSLRQRKLAILKFPWLTQDTKAWTKGTIKKFLWFLRCTGKKPLRYLAITCKRWVPLIRHKTYLAYKRSRTMKWEIWGPFPISRFQLSFPSKIVLLLRKI